MERFNRSRIALILLASITIISFIASAASAVETEIHGYGFQGYLLSNGNNYLEAQEGTFEFTEIAVLVNSKVDDRTNVWIQLFGDNQDFGLDWAFVDYRVTNDIYARFGQMKFPIGIYNEIRDNKMLQLSMLEPIMYRQHLDFIFEAYRGVGAYYNGTVSVDLFGGAPVIEEEEGLQIEVKNLYGGRVIYNTPLTGLRIMGSYASFSEEITDVTGTVASTLSEEGKEKLAVGSIDFVRGDLDVKAEYAKKEGVDEDIMSYYAQAGYTIGDAVTPFIRYEYAKNEDEACSASDPSCYQKEYVVGVGYKFNPYFGLKAEEHWMRGYLLPVTTGEVTRGEGSERWNMFVAGMNFMF